MKRALASVTATWLFSSAVTAQLPAGGSLGASREAGEPEIGSRLPSATRPAEKADHDGAAVMRGMADCVLSRRPAYVTGYLAKADGSPDAGVALHKMNDVMSRCLAAPAPYSYRSLQTTGLLWRGVLAESYMRAHPAPVPAAVASVRPHYDAAWIGDGKGGIVREMAACLAKVQPGRVVQLLQSTTASAGERDALAALAPAEAGCLRSGATLNTNVAGLRAALAEALYHREFDASPPTAPAMVH